VENCFVSREWLAERIDRLGRANVMLAASDAGGARLALDASTAALARAFQLEDAELAWRRDEESGYVELTSKRILLESPIVRALERVGEPTLGVFTYFVNSIEAGGRSTPYSTVTAVGALAVADEPRGRRLAFAAIVPVGSRERRDRAHRLTARISTGVETRSSSPPHPTLRASGVSRSGARPSASARSFRSCRRRAIRA
jgi:hypothetical protein